MEFDETWWRADIEAYWSSLEVVNLRFSLSVTISVHGRRQKGAGGAPPVP